MVTSVPAAAAFPKLMWKASAALAPMLVGDSMSPSVRLSLKALSRCCRLNVPFLSHSCRWSDAPLLLLARHLPWAVQSPQWKVFTSGWGIFWVWLWVALHPSQSLWQHSTARFGCRFGGLGGWFCPNSDLARRNKAEGNWVDSREFVPML